VFYNDQGKCPDHGLGHIQPDAAFECGDGTNREPDIPAAPKMALLEKDMGHMMGQTFDDETLDHSDFAIRCVDAIASVNPDLPQGGASWVTSRAGLSAAVTAANPSP